MIKQLVESGSNLTDLLDGVVATQEMAEIRDNTGQRQRGLEERHKKFDIGAMLTGMAGNLSEYSSRRSHSLVRSNSSLSSN